MLVHTYPHKVVCCLENSNIESFVINLSLQNISSFKWRVIIFLYVFRADISSKRYELKRSAALVISDTADSLPVCFGSLRSFDYMYVWLLSFRGCSTLAWTLLSDLPTNFEPLSVTDGPALAKLYRSFDTGVVGILLDMCLGPFLRPLGVDIVALWLMLMPMRYAKWLFHWTWSSW